MHMCTLKNLFFKSVTVDVTGCSAQRTYAASRCLSLLASAPHTAAAPRSVRLVLHTNTHICEPIVELLPHG